MLPQRLLSKIEVKDNGCWEWQGATNHAGYGIAYIGDLPTSTSGKCGPAHKVVFEALTGLVPARMQLDHTCHMPDVCGVGRCEHRRCVNPAHLEITTARENTLRSGAAPAVNAAKTTCHRGHQFDESNTHVNPSGERICRQCQRDRRARRSPEQIEKDKRKARERAAANRAKNPQLHRDRCRESRLRKKAEQSI